VARHVGIAQVDIVFVDGHNAIHDMLHLSFLVTFCVSPFSVNNILLGNFGTNLHELLFYQILNSFDRDCGRCKMGNYLHGNISNQFVFVRYARGIERFGDCVFNLADGKVFFFPISFNDRNLSVIHNLCFNK